MAAALILGAGLIMVASLVLASLTHAFTQDERDQRNPSQIESDR